MIEPKDIETTEITIPAEDLISPIFCSIWLVTPQDAVVFTRNSDELIDKVKPMLIKQVLEEIFRWEDEFLTKPYITNVMFIHESRIGWEDSSRKVIKYVGRTRVRAIDGHLVGENESYTMKVLIP